MHVWSGGGAAVLAGAAARRWAAAVGGLDGVQLLHLRLGTGSGELFALTGLRICSSRGGFMAAAARCWLLRGSDALARPVRRGGVALQGAAP